MLEFLGFLPRKRAKFPIYLTFLTLIRNSWFMITVKLKIKFRKTVPLRFSFYLTKFVFLSFLTRKVKINFEITLSFGHTYNTF